VFGIVSTAFTPSLNVTCSTSRDEARAVVGGDDLHRPLDHDLDVGLHIAQHFALLRFGQAQPGLVQGAQLARRRGHDLAQQSSRAMSRALFSTAASIRCPPSRWSSPA
jgi:hypothetical protein